MLNKSAFRIIDANLNRVSEGIRVLEDLARFSMDNKEVSKSLRNLRHRIRGAASTMHDKGIMARDSVNDPGFKISQAARNDDRADIRDLAAGNFKRVQEGLRSLEEYSKVAGHYDISKIFESCRYEAYTLEKNLTELLFTEKRKNILDTDIYCITAHEHSKGRSNKEVVRLMLDAGIKLIQYREKDMTLLTKYRECVEIRKMTIDYGAKFIVNDDVELGVMVNADGVHVGQDDFPIPEVRKIVGENIAIGLSTHSPGQAQKAVADGADYIGVGPIFSTKTKKDVCDPVGFEYLDYAVKNVSIPFVAIGGIKAHNLGEVVKRGAKCAALVTEIVGADDIKKMVKELREIMKKSASE